MSTCIMVNKRLKDWSSKNLLSSRKVNSNITKMKEAVNTGLPVSTDDRTLMKGAYHEEAIAINPINNNFFICFLIMK